MNIYICIILVYVFLSIIFCLEPLNEWNALSVSGLLLGEDQAEPKVGELAVGSVGVAIRRTTVHRVVVPATTAIHAVRPIHRINRIQAVRPTRRTSRIGL